VPDPIVEDELRLLAQVNARLEATPAPAPPSESSLVQELEHLRDALREGSKTDDQPALMQQWDRQSALLRQLRNAHRPAEVDSGSPYFAHLRLSENGAQQDILLGKTTRLLPGTPIVDWRNAPVSRIFYRYKQGEEYEEAIAGRLKTGELVARRTVTMPIGDFSGLFGPG
jgi:ATP-dependent DNA helicase UvrD/PcrA